MKKTKKDLIKEENKKLLPYIIVIIIIALTLQIFEGIIISIVKMIFWTIVLIFSIKWFNKNKK